MRRLLAGVLLGYARSTDLLAIWNFLQPTAPSRSLTRAPGARSAAGVPAPEVSDFALFETRASRLTPRTRAVVVAEISHLENTFEDTPRDAVDRPALARHLAEDYGELESAAEREEARAESEHREVAAGQAKTIVTRARTQAVKWYALLEKEHPNDPSLDEILFYLGYELQLGGEPDNARRVYFELVQKAPPSRYVPLAYLAFGELFSDEAASDPTRWDLAVQAYEQVAKYPPPENKAYGYACYKLGYALWNQGKLQRAVDAFRKTIEHSATYPESPEADALGESADHDVAVLLPLTAAPEAGARAR